MSVIHTKFNGAGAWANPATWVGGVVPRAANGDVGYVETFFTLIDIPAGESCTQNRGTVTTNWGNIDNNFMDYGYWGTVVTNKGTIGQNNARVTTNEGNVTNNNTSGSITNSPGTVGTNAGTIFGNAGSVGVNSRYGYIGGSCAGVGTNEGYVNILTGICSINAAPNPSQYYSGGQINEAAFGSIVVGNYGTIQVLRGIVGSNYGTIVLRVIYSQSMGSGDWTSLGTWLGGMVPPYPTSAVQSIVQVGFTLNQVPAGYACDSVLGTVTANYGTVKSVDAGGVVTTNYGTVTLVTGVVGENRGRVTTNTLTGTVNTNAASGTVSTNLGTVMTNYGLVTSLGTSSQLVGVVMENYGYVRASWGTVGSNLSNGVNIGTVNDNNGVIGENWSVVNIHDSTGVMTSNRGLVKLSYGPIAANYGEVTHLSGLISANHGTVYQWADGDIDANDGMVYLMAYGSSCLGVYILDLAFVDPLAENVLMGVNYYYSGSQVAGTLGPNSPGVETGSETLVLAGAVIPYNDGFLANNENVGKATTRVKLA